MTEKGIQEGQTQEERDAYLCGYADGRSGVPIPTTDGQSEDVELLAASLRSSARALLGAEALGEIHQAGHRMAAVLTDVALERQDQAALHGERHHIEGTWLAILMEEVGEVASDTPEPRPHPHAGGPAPPDGALPGDYTGGGRRRRLGGADPAGPAGSQLGPGGAVKKPVQIPLFQENWCRYCNRDNRPNYCGRRVCKLVTGRGRR